VVDVRRFLGGGLRPGEMRGWELNRPPRTEPRQSAKRITPPIMPPMMPLGDVQREKTENQKNAIKSKRISISRHPIRDRPDRIEPRTSQRPSRPSNLPGRRPSPLKRRRCHATGVSNGAACLKTDFNADAFLRDRRPPFPGRRPSAWGVLKGEEGCFQLRIKLPRASRVWPVQFRKPHQGHLPHR
jgi:hypothetical protein